MANLLRDSKLVLFTLGPSVPARAEFVSSNVVDLLGVSAEDIVAGTGKYREVIHPADREHLDDATGQCLVEGAASCEYRIRSPSGEYRWYAIKLRLERDEAGNPARILGTACDNTELRRLEDERNQATAAVRTRNDELRAIVEHSVLAMVVLDASGIVRACNPAALATFGVADRAWDDARAVISRLLAPSVADIQLSGGRLRVEVRTEANGHRSRRLRVELGEIVGAQPQRRFVAVVSETAPDPSQSEALRQAERNEEAANRAKREFLAVMNHEILTPLNGVLGMTELLARDPEHPKREAWLQRLATNARSLESRVKHVLEVSRIDAGEVMLLPTKTDARALVWRVVQRYADDLARRGIELQVDISPALPDFVLVDGRRIEEMLGCLLDNAAKFTERGYVRVDLGCADTGDALSLAIDVSDTGIGIAAEHHDAVFERFFQVDASSSRRFGGSGLGLSIVSSLARLMGGNVTADGVPGAGSVFSLRIPAQPVERSMRERAPPAAAVPRILVADDNPDNREIALRGLERAGFEVTLAKDGIDAAELIAANDFDLVFMDIEMPRMDGLQATRLARASLQRVGRTMPAVVAVTAHALAAYRQRCREAGIDLCLAKPISGGELADFAISLLPDHIPPTAAPVVAPTAPASGLDALDPDARELLPLFLQSRRREVPLLQRCVRRQEANLREAGRLGHRLKGSAATYGFPEAADLGAQLEEAALAGDAAAAAKVSTEILQWIARLESLDMSAAPPVGA